MSQPQLHIQPGVLDSIPAPIAQMPWTWIVIIVFVAIAAVFIISWTTQRSIRAMASTARQMMNEARTISPDGHGGRQSISGLSAIGRAELDWEPGAFRLGLRFRIPGGGAGVEGATIVTDRFVQQLYGLGVTDADILQSDPAFDDEGNGTVDLTVSVLTDPEARSTKILEAGLRSGFSEIRDGGREEISFEDASELAGRAAVEDAMANTGILLDHLKIVRDGLKVVSARIHSEPGNGRIVRVAEIVWDGDR